MITCYLRYEIDPHKTREFEHYARLWIPLVERFGGRHHGYFLPHEGANDIALALFSFDSLADYETYRSRAADDADGQAALAHAHRTGCIRRYERSFMRPVFDGPEEQESFVV
ncbi:NIPSNAP family protein [Salinisphaera sp. T31B1]|uniref:NIPSNAP family protein n=1 Tax=Salinisphaera sp. T31B1 TaxID=727963 RepID=UPI00333EECD1